MHTQGPTTGHALARVRTRRTHGARLDTQWHTPHLHATRSPARATHTVTHTVAPLLKARRVTVTRRLASELRLLRHYELAHLLSNIEKPPLPILGSMLPFWNPRFRSFPSVGLI